jgi:hypothetical protein
MVVSYRLTGRPINDPGYDPYPEGVEIHHNRFGRSGYRPDHGALEALRQRIGENLPPVLWDGFRPSNGMGPADVVCVHDNDPDGFAMLDAPGRFASPRLEAGPNRCDPRSVPGVKLAGTGAG